MELRKAKRVVFERGFAANMMAIDGTWRRPCTLEDVSETGARLTSTARSKVFPSRNFSCCFRLWETRTGAANSPGSMAIKLASFSSNRATRGKNPKDAFPASGRCLTRVPLVELRSVFNYGHYDRHILGALTGETGAASVGKRATQAEAATS